MGFFPKGLDPFKIQTKFKFHLFSGFLIQIRSGILTSSQKQSCPFGSYISPFQVWKFLDIRKIIVWAIGTIWKIIGDIQTGRPTRNSPGPPFLTGHGPHNKGL
jgi:hypothetical protein